MAITKRKNPPRDTEVRRTVDSGLGYTCDACGADISHTVRIRCSETGPNGQPTCDEVDLCGSCFCEGKEIGRHKRWHRYRVVEQHAYPIFVEDWGADEELLLIDGCQTYGLGNWQDIAEHVGTRTKEEVEQHYLQVYINSDDFPVPKSDVKFDVDQDTFQARKKRRLEDMQSRPPPLPPPKPLASAPSCHEVAGFMPGRLEFETEWENDAEGLVKDLEFGLIYKFGGDEQPERVEDVEVIEEEEEDGEGGEEERDADADDGKKEANGEGKERDKNGEGKERDKEGVGGDANGQGEDSAVKTETTEPKTDESLGDGQRPDTSNPAQSEAPKAVAPNQKEKGKTRPQAQPQEGAGEPEEPEEILMEEDDQDLELKLAILEMYSERYDRRMEAKGVILDRNLVDYKRNIQAERKRPKEERDLINRVKVFARIQTAADQEAFIDGLIYEVTLRKRIAELQEYRKMGITSFAEAEKYEKDKAARQSTRNTLAYRDSVLSYDRVAARNARAPGAMVEKRVSGGAPSMTNGDDPLRASREGTPKGGSRRSGQPLNLSNSSSLYLLSPAEQQLCSELRLLPKPFLFIKEAIFRELARRGGKLSRTEALQLVKIDQTKTGHIWDFYVRGEGAERGEEGEEMREESDVGPSNGANGHHPVSMMVNGTARLNGYSNSPAPSHTDSVS